MQAAEQIGQSDTVSLMVEQEGGVDKIEQLQQHENEDVYHAALSIIDKYFSVEEEDVAELAPESTDDGQFQFAGATAAPQGGFNF